nr:uncharacterized protein LOC123766341 [Procambarus clarkii]
MSKEERAEPLAISKKESALKMKRLYQKFMQSFSMKYQGRKFFETFFIQHINVTGNKRDSIIYEYVSEQYVTYCNKEGVQIADTKAINLHLSYLGLLSQSTDNKSTLLPGVFFHKTVNAELCFCTDEGVYVPTICSRQPIGLQMFRETPGDFQTVGVTDEYNLEYGTERFPWQYPGRESFEAFLQKHLIITHNLADNMTRNDLLSAYTTFCCVHNYQFAQAASIVFHLWFLGVLTDECESSNGFAGLILYSDESRESSPDIVILDCPPTAPKHNYHLQLPKPQPVHVPLQQVTPNREDPSSEIVILDSPPTGTTQNPELSVKFPVKFTYARRPAIENESVKTSSDQVSSSLSTSTFLKNEPNGMAQVFQYPGQQSFELFCMSRLLMTNKTRDIVFQKDLISFYLAFCKDRNIQAAWLPFVVWHLGICGIVVKERIGCRCVHYVFHGLKFQKGNCNTNKTLDRAKASKRMNSTSQHTAFQLGQYLSIKSQVVGTRLQRSADPYDKVERHRSTHVDSVDSPEKFSLEMFFTQMVKLTGNTNDIVVKEVLLSVYAVFCRSNNLRPSPPLFTLRYLSLLGFRVKIIRRIRSVKHVYSGLRLLTTTKATDLRLWRK